jgi:2-amino-4-hydroxy-6-hydroxymethyldihydropteridine diphosphokinase
MFERAFVVVPLLEIAPDLDVPGKGPLRAFLPGVADQAITRLN